MERSTEMGSNRTGIDASPFDSKSMMNGAEKFFSTSGNMDAMHALQRDFDRQATPVGSVPIPGTPKGMLKSMMKKMTGHNPEMFINKLGERLAYERSGVRIYESFIEKCSALAEEGESNPEMSISRLREFCDQEAQHFHMIKQCMETLGADPTAQTPDADVSGVAAQGMMKVVSDPRTSIGQCLEAMLSLEMTDNAAWELLIKLAEDMGMDDMAREFGQALKQEDIHLQQIRDWHERLVRSQARMKM